MSRGDARARDVRDTALKLARRYAMPILEKDALELLDGGGRP
jgi:hypothetical protein